MRVSEVRKKYPEFFVTIEAAVWDDSGSVTYKGHPVFIRDSIRRRLAYNAAAVATFELHKIMVANRKKAKVAGKTPHNKPMRKRSTKKRKRTASA